MFVEINLTTLHTSSFRISTLSQNLSHTHTHTLLLWASWGWAVAAAVGVEKMEEHDIPLEYVCDLVTVMYLPQSHPDRPSALVRAFEATDLDKGGDIDVEEFSVLMKIIAEGVTKEEMAVWFALADADGSGALQIPDFEMSLLYLSDASLYEKDLSHKLRTVRLEFNIAHTYMFDLLVHVQSVTQIACHMLSVHAHGNLHTVYLCPL